MWRQRSSKRNDSRAHWYRDLGYARSCMRAELLSRPLALAKHGHPSAVGMDTVDVGLVRADHPVDVNEALVAAVRQSVRASAWCRRRSIWNSIGQSAMAGGVLVDAWKNNSPLFEIGEECGTAPPRAGANPRRYRAPCSALPRRAWLASTIVLPRTARDAVDQRPLVGQRLELTTCPSTRRAWAW